MHNIRFKIKYNIKGFQSNLGVEKNDDFKNVDSKICTLI